MHVLRHYFEKYPNDADKVVLSLKGAFDIRTGPDGSPEGIRASVDTALAVLGGFKTIDVFECSRVDPKVPIETSMQTLAELVAEGKIGGIGLSEVNANTIRKAHAIHPIAAVEVELSLFTPDPLHNGVLQTCQECKLTLWLQHLADVWHSMETLSLTSSVIVDIIVIAYSPISRGWLTGDLRKFEDLAEDDFRHRLPRFQEPAFSQNVKLVEAVQKLAIRKNTTVAQIAISWVASQGAVPIPGSVRVDRVRQNCETVDLSEEDLKDLKIILDTFPIVGERYGGQQEALLNA